MNASRIGTPMSECECRAACDAEYGCNAYNYYPTTNECWTWQIDPLGDVYVGNGGMGNDGYHWCYSKTTVTDAAVTFEALGDDICTNYSVLLESSVTP
jgi:hypothetical protein